MGRGGGGGGSRGGGGRSGGSRGGSFRSSSSSGRSRSSFSSGRGSSFSSRPSGGFGGPRPSGSYGGFRPSGGYHRPPPPPRGPSYHRTSYRRTSSPSGCLTSIIAYVIVILVLIAIIPTMFGGGIIRSGSDITRSTIEREKLDGQYVTLSSEWYDDSAMGWIASESTLESGLKDFYNETGVQPYLVITDVINGDTTPTGDEVWEYADSIYDQMFDDEGHMVFVFQCEDGGVDYMMAACTGAQAKVVLDDAEALEILYDYVDYYFYSDLDEDEMFAEAFRDAGERIMTKQTPTSQVAIKVIGVVAVAAIVLVIVKSVNKRSKEKAAETERILNTPVEKFGDTKLDDLKDKYDNT